MNRILSYGGVVERLTSNEREVVFLVGSALTMKRGDRPGVPTVPEMVDRVIARLGPRGGDPFAIRRQREKDAEDLRRATAGKPDAYAVAFQRLLDLRGQDAVNALIEESVLEARLPGAPRQVSEHDGGWSLTPGVQALGELLAQCPRFGSLVVTTNFDPLIEVAVQRAGGVCHFTAPAGDFDPGVAGGPGVHVLHVHGHWRQTDTLHTGWQLTTARPRLQAWLRSALRDRTLVVLGYGGWEDLVTSALAELALDGTAKPDVLWCFYEADEAVARAKYPSVLQRLEPLALAGRARFAVGVDLHVLLPEVLRRVVPVRLSRRIHQSEDGHHPAWPSTSREALRLLRSGQAVQVVSEPGQGRSPFLRWIAETEKREGRAVASLDAKDATGRHTPGDFLRIVGECVGLGDRVRGLLTRRARQPDQQDIAAAWDALGEVTLVVDNADALAERDHRFDSAFLDDLRARGQKKTLRWISASQDDLEASFQGTGLTSRFLSESTRLHLGAAPLELGTALGETLADAGAAEELLALVGPHIRLLEWILEAIEDGRSFDGDGARGPELPGLARVLGREAAGALAPAARDWVASDFERWWARSGAAERALLGRLPVRQDALTVDERTVAARLRARGLAWERGQELAPAGELWGDFIGARGPAE